MKRILLWAITAIASLTASAEVFTFDFHQPETLNPSIAEPAQKEAVNLDGMTFASGPVKVEFTAADSGNTHVRIYHSYDAGVDLRIYDNDMMTVSVPENLYIKSIQFTMSLSGNSTGTNDINFIPDNGDFVWEDERWTPDADSYPSSVDLVSAMQSRIYTMSVDVDYLSSIPEITGDGESVQYLTLSGRSIKTFAVSGIYLRVTNRGVTKIIKRPDSVL